jgi:hypothetical protein
MKPIKEMVWPVDNYTNKIHDAMKCMFSLNPNLSYTVAQMREHLVRGFSWLNNPNKRQAEVLEMIISKGIGKLVQRGVAVKVTSSTSVERQWQLKRGADVSGYTNITSSDSVAANDKVLAKIKGRSLNAQALWKLNNPEKIAA